MGLLRNGCFPLENQPVQNSAHEAPHREVPDMKLMVAVAETIEAKDIRS